MNDVPLRLHRPRPSSSPARRNGIGAACARLFAASGANVALWDVDDARGADRWRPSSTPTGTRIRALHCDVARSADVDAAPSPPRCAAFGRIDILVNNAGIFRAADFLDITEADWDAVIDVNLKGAFLVGQAVAREMAASGGGAIVNMSSVNGVMAIPSIASYNASKGGIDQLTRAMALVARRPRHPRQRGRARHDRDRARAARRCSAATKRTRAS